jgi:hypothetical protein
MNPSQTRDPRSLVGHPKQPEQAFQGWRWALLLALPTLVVLSGCSDPPLGPGPGMPDLEASPHPSGTLPFQLVGTASDMGDRIRVTPSAPRRTGAMWTRDQVIVTEHWVAEFSFQITEPRDGGADGLAFVIHNHRPGALGGGGGGLGYHGIPNSLAVEFDTWQNDGLELGETGEGDPNDNHVSVHTGGTGANSAHGSYSLGHTTDIPDLSGGAVHHVVLVYDPGWLEVWIDDGDQPVLSVGVDLAETLDLRDGDRAWLGITAATGLSSQNHDILRFRFGSDAGGPWVDWHPKAGRGGLVSRWSGEGDARDGAGTNHGAVIGNVEFGHGLVGQGFAFDGQDGWVMAPGDGLEHLRNGITMAGWVRLGSLPDRIQRFVTVGHERLVLRHDGEDGPGQFHVYAVLGGRIRHIRVDGVLREGCFHHVAATFDGTRLRAFLDGNEVGQFDAAGLSVPVHHPTRVVLSSPEGETLDGVLDEVEAYDRALNSGEIRALYQKPVGAKCSDDA